MTAAQTQAVDGRPATDNLTGDQLARVDALAAARWVLTRRLRTGALSGGPAEPEVSPIDLHALASFVLTGEDPFVVTEVQGTDEVVDLSGHRHTLAVVDAAFTGWVGTVCTEDNACVLRDGHAGGCSPRPLCLAPVEDGPACTLPLNHNGACQ